MRKRLRLCAAAAAAVPSLAACAGGGGGRKAGPEVMGKEWDLAKGADVCIVGNCRRPFKNGATHSLGDPRVRFGASVCVSGGDVYVACETHPTASSFAAGALLWKNGAAQA